MGAAEALGGSIDDDLKNTLWVGVELIVPDAQHRPALVFGESVATDVAFAFSVLTAVELDNQLRLPAREIGDVRANWQLASELGTKTRKQTPQFRSCLVAALRSKRAR